MPQGPPHRHHHGTAPRRLSHHRVRPGGRSSRAWRPQSLAAPSYQLALQRGAGGADAPVAPPTILQLESYLEYLEPAATASDAAGGDDADADDAAADDASGGGGTMTTAQRAAATGAFAEDGVVVDD